MRMSALTLQTVEIGKFIDIPELPKSAILLISMHL